MDISFKKYKIESELLPLEMREKIRQSGNYKFFFAQYHGQFNSPRLVGALMDEIGKLGRQVTRDDWEQYYVSNVRSYDQIYDMVDKLRTKVNYDNRQYNNSLPANKKYQERKLMTFAHALSYWWIHIVDSAYDGVRNQQNAKKLIENWIQERKFRYTVRYTTPEVDTKMGIDLEIVSIKTGKIVKGVQVKNDGWFAGRHESIKKQKRIIRMKYRLYDAVYHAPVWELNITASEAQRKPIWFKINLKEEI